ncbi:MAG: hypothetical protein QXR57_05965 [Metallosphaera sp.]|uniref:hypothetical protein n=1 Tax=Metallosphaera sp. TaxID=2020860 RepID=UPI0031606D7D
MSLLLKMNRVTSRVLVMLLTMSFRFLSLHQFMFIVIPFLLDGGSNSFFLTNIALIPVAALLLLISMIVYLVRKIRNR